MCHLELAFFGVQIDLFESDTWQVIHIVWHMYAYMTGTIGSEVADMYMTGER
jgi:hypothetical protein